MKKRMITADEIEAELQKMGAVEIPEEEFQTSPEYKEIYKYYRKNIDAASNETRPKKNTLGKKHKVKT